MAQTDTKALFDVPITEEEVLKRLKETSSHHRYAQLDREWQRRFMDFCTGRKTLPMTYDPFFKRIFHPDIHPHRLERFISGLIGKEVKLKTLLPSEDILLEGNSLLIMDVLVELTDGSLATVEIQKIPYAFPGERISCYASDLVLRQYSRVKGEKGKGFVYRDMKPVYVIVIYEKSEALFHHMEGQYLHEGSYMFNTGLELHFLEKIYLVALDVFREAVYHKDIEKQGKREQTGWLSLLTTETIEEAERNIREYPWLEEIYREMAAYREKPEEVLYMFSEALRIMDQNTVMYMIEEQQVKIAEEKKKNTEQQKEIEKEKKKNAEQQKEIEEEKKRNAEQQKEIERLQKLLKEAGIQ